MKSDVQYFGGCFRACRPIGEVGRRFALARPARRRFQLMPLGEFCPVCMLRCALTDDISGDESAGPTGGDDSLKYRFEHYEIVMGEDGMPVELGRGAMGVTYKALDVDLRCPVTLKVISERYLNDESARLRFLREARAAASVPSSKRCLGLPPGQNRRELLLRDGVCGGGNAREPHQTLRPA